MNRILNFIKKNLLICAIVPFVAIAAVPWVKAGLRLREKSEPVTLTTLNKERKYQEKKAERHNQEAAKKLKGAWPVKTSTGGEAWLFSTKAGLFLSEGDQEPTPVTGGPQMDIHSFAQATSGDWWVASKDGLWRRHPDGQWEQRHTAEAHEVTLRQGLHPVLTTKHDGVYQSEDQGQTWVSLKIAERYRHKK